MRDLLRGLPVFDTDLPVFDPLAVLAHPVDLFRAWLEEAIAAGAPEPHAVTVSTVDADGVPDARVLILKDVDHDAFSIASTTSGALGVQLDRHPVASLSSYWPSRGRQIRVRGVVEPADPSVTAADFLARSPDARAKVLAGSTAPAALDEARRLLERDPDLVAPSWQVYRLVPRSVEFFQATVSRHHVRLRYRREGASWAREVL